MKMNKSYHQNQMILENTSLIDLSQACDFQVNVSQFYTTKIFLKLFNGDSWLPNSQPFVSSLRASTLTTMFIMLYRQIIFTLISIPWVNEIPENSNPLASLY